ncbi:hypothetical protein B2G46_01165 [Limosilactobacillus reuteri]|nr:hypothetical protein B2G46_01165 [Limosilactobacillus reuteri]
MSTARADYRSDLASSLVVNFHDILTIVCINKETVEKGIITFFNSLFSIFSYLSNKLKYSP